MNSCIIQNNRPKNTKQTQERYSFANLSVINHPSAIHAKGMPSWNVFALAQLQRETQVYGSTIRTLICSFCKSWCDPTSPADATSTEGICPALLGATDLAAQTQSREMADIRESDFHRGSKRESPFKRWRECLSERKRERERDLY